MERAIATDVHSRDFLRPRESAANKRKHAHMTTFMIPYTPVASRPVVLPEIPRFKKICGAYARRSQSAKAMSATARKFAYNNYYAIRQRCIELGQHWITHMALVPVIC